MLDLKEVDLIKLADDFHSDEKCRDILEQLRWPNGEPLFQHLFHSSCRPYAVRNATARAA